MRTRDVVLILRLENGNIIPDMLIKDAPIDIPLEDIVEWATDIHLMEPVWIGRQDIVEFDQVNIDPDYTIRMEWWR